MGFALVVVTKADLISVSIRSPSARLEALPSSCHHDIIASSNLCASALSARKTMDTNILQRFLDIGLFDVGDDDERLSIFHKAADDLAKVIAKEPRKAVSAVLVAIDPNVPDEDPVLEETEAAVREHWKAFRNKYPERPKGLLRPVLLEALEKASTESAEISSVMWLASINLLPRLEAHKERSLVKELLDTKGILSETDAEKIWSPGDVDSEVDLPKIIFKLGDKAEGKTDAGALEKAMFNAAGPHDANGNAAGKDPNQYYSNQGQHWSNQFVPKASKAIASAIDKAIAPLAGQANVIAEQLEPALKKFGKEMSGAIGEWVTNAVSSTRQRSDLLWWKESLYSPALRSTYRGLSPAEVAISMAHDLHNIAAVPSPQSVEYFLRETIKAVSPQDPELSIADVLKSAQRSRIIQPVAPPSSVQRVCLLTSLGYNKSAEIPVELLPAWVGIRGDLRLPCSEMAVWLFRDAQALSLTYEESGK